MISQTTIHYFIHDVPFLLNFNIPYGTTMAHLSVSGLHMRNISVSLREPLQTLPTRPASGLHMGPALLFGLFPRTVSVFHGAVPLLLWDGMRILVPINIVCLYAAALCLRVHVSCMNTLQKSEEDSFRKKKMPKNLSASD